MLHLIKLVVVIVVVLIVTSLSIDAFDTAGGSRVTLLAQLGSLYRGSGCPTDMILVTTAVTPFCLDRFEVSPARNCPSTEPHSTFDTEQNMQAGGCRPETAEGRIPWQYVSYEQADTLCARVGKRLPEAREWYDGARGTPLSTEDCQLVGDIVETGSKKSCRSGVDAADMVGNLWEYVAGLGVDGKFGDYSVPKSGYITLADDAGLPVTTGESAVAAYGADYVWTKDAGPTVRARGGFYSAQEDGGIYSMQAGVSPTFSSAAIGFRCARSL